MKYVSNIVNLMLHLSTLTCVKKNQICHIKQFDRNEYSYLNDEVLILFRTTCHKLIFGNLKCNCLAADVPVWLIMDTLRTLFFLFLL